MATTRKRSRQQDENTTQTDNVFTASAGQLPPKNVKAATTRPKAKGRVGNKEGRTSFSDIPFDVILEICKHLHPADLLHLARTTKWLRSFLMSRMKEDIWKESMQNDQTLPGCPSSLSLPQHINLLFSPHCHICSKNGVETVYWDFQARYCSKCRDGQLISPDHSVTTKFTELLGGSCYGTFNVITSKRHDMFHRPQIESFLQKWENLPRPAKVARGEANTQTSRSKEEEALLAQQRRATYYANHHASAYRKWADQVAKHRKTELNSLREARLLSIVEKLTALGYTKELASIAPKYERLLANNPQARQPKLLTEQAWSKLRDDAIDLMDIIRGELLEAKRKHEFPERLDALRKMVSQFDELSLPYDARCKPDYLDLGILPEVRKVLEMPLENDVDWEPIRQQLPALIKCWQATAKGKLLQVLSQTAGFEAADEDLALHLATAFFQCKGCEQVLHFPFIMSHKCYSVRQLIKLAPTEYPWECRLLVGQYNHLWSAEHFMCIPSTAKHLVTICGMDPIRTTMRDMDNLNQRFWRPSPGRAETKYIRTWRSVIVEDSKTSDLENGQRAWQWNVVSPAEHAIVDMLEDNRRHITLQQYYAQHWVCALCTGNRRESSLFVVQRHLQEEHGVKDARWDSPEVYRLPSAPYHDLRPEHVALIPHDIQFEDLCYAEKKLLETGRASYFRFPKVQVAEDVVVSVGATV